MQSFSNTCVINITSDNYEPFGVRFQLPHHYCDAFTNESRDSLLPFIPLRMTILAMSSGSAVFVGFREWIRQLYGISHFGLIFLSGNSTNYKKERDWSRSCERCRAPQSSFWRNTHRTRWKRSENKYFNQGLSGQCSNWLDTTFAILAPRGLASVIRRCS